MGVATLLRVLNHGLRAWAGLDEWPARLVAVGLTLAIAAFVLWGLRRRSSRHAGRVPFGG